MGFHHFIFILFGEVGEHCFLMQLTPYDSTVWSCSCASMEHVFYGKHRMLVFLSNPVSVTDTEIPVWTLQCRAYHFGGHALQ